MAEERVRYTLTHENIRDCPSPRWIALGLYICPGHPLEGRTVLHHILKEVADA